MPVISVGLYLNQDVIWSNDFISDEITEDRIDIWHVKVSANPGVNKYLYSLLDTTEQQRSAKFHKEDDKRRFTIGHGALRIILSKYLSQLPAEIQVTETQRKKPILADRALYQLHYNISHAGGYVLIAISNADVGIDVEIVDNTFYYNDIIESSFSTEEIDFVRRSGHPHKTFYLLWTRKEALLKGTGKGLTDNLAGVPALEGVHTISAETIDSTNSWKICSFGIGNEYVVSAAYSDAIDTVRFFQLNIDKHPDKDFSLYQKLF